ncbi:hypothetical protein [cf. Phormidesmis sp. LEGE 11477]|uniref:hypothetical protein n=1 Tax=cf. Phormidesmis sp. LEGE 11477 TaxID=1828680 RepID=UPI0018815B58|nr:hypothetical protein [cf. Phormidesmis sp. LEGE 11477]MBE9063957.1 hypothetical protein [cf. Phormidesmis sp. LEGE 11477]
MAEFRVNQPIETSEPKIEVTVDPENPLPVGQARFRLIVVDDAGNESAADEVNVVIRDSERPTAVLDAPERVNFRDSFTLSGERSSDVGGRIVSYRWELVNIPERPNRPGIEGPVIFRPGDRPVINRPVIDNPNIPTPINNG